MFFLIKMIFKLATIAVFLLIGYVIYAKLTGKNVDFGIGQNPATEYVEFV